MSHEVYGRGHCQHEGCNEPVSLIGTGGEAEVWYMGPVDAKTIGKTLIRPITIDKSELCYWHRKEKQLKRISLKY